jgi:hypothetical protein
MSELTQTTLEQGLRAAVDLQTLKTSHQDPAAYDLSIVLQAILASLARIEERLQESGR